MQKNTKKRGAILSAAAVIGFFLIYLAIVLFAALSEAYGDLVGMLAIALLAFGIGAVIWGVLRALRQRLKELDSGEEEEARKY